MIPNSSTSSSKRTLEEQKFNHQSNINSVMSDCISNCDLLSKLEANHNNRTSIKSTSKKRNKQNRLNNIEKDIQQR
jgi:hypothetical protein